MATAVSLLPGPALITTPSLVVLVVIQSRLRGNSQVVTAVDS